MYIQALEIKNFKKLEDARVEFPEDITVVKGNNESGKTTVRDALVAALFFDPTNPATPQYIKDFQSWNSDKLYQLNLYFEADGEKYVLEKDFENKKNILKTDVGDVLSHDFEEISEKLRDLGGYNSKDIFANVSVIGKDNLVLMDSGKKKIMESLQDMVSGSSAVSVSALLRKLKKTRDDMTKGLDPSRPVKNAGKIRMAQEGLGELEDKLQETRTALKEKEEAEVILGEFAEKLDKIKKEKDHLSREYEAGKKYFSAKVEIEKLTTQLDEITEDINAYEKLDKEHEDASSQVKDLKPLKPEDMEKAEELQSKIKLFASQVTDLEKKVSELEEKHREKYYPSQKIFSIVSASLFLGGFLGLVYPVFYAMWFLLAAFVAFMFLTGRYSEAVSLKSLKIDYEEKKEHFEKLKKLEEKKLAEFNIGSFEEMKEHNKTIDVFKNRIASIEEQKRTLLRGKDIEELRKTQKEFARQLGVEQAKITEEQRSDPPTTQRQREVEAKLERLEEEIEKMGAKYAEANARVENIKVSQEDITLVEEKVSSAKESVQRFTRRANVYKIVEEGLEEARRLSLAKTKETLEESMGEYIDQITSGKYSSVRLEDNFELQVYSTEKEDYVSGDELSAGAADQLYIVARFALIGLLNGKSAGQDIEEEGASKFLRRPVAILDDPFVNFDEERRDNMRHVLERLSGEFQVVLFTCTSSYDNWGGLIEINQSITHSSQ
ncbi:MAG: AAA family ATPase [Candidatus Spechtbacterales bacterium]